MLAAATTGRRGYVMLRLLLALNLINVVSAQIQTTGESYCFIPVLVAAVAASRPSRCTQS